MLLVLHCTTQSEISERQLQKWTTNKRYPHLRIAARIMQTDNPPYWVLNTVMTKRHGHPQELQKQLMSKQLNKDSLKIRQLNDRLMQAERAFTSREGIFKQEWFKHLVSGYSCTMHFLSGKPILTLSVTTNRCMDLQTRMTGTLQSIPV